MLSGSEAYIALLAYYNSVKIASRMNIAGATAIYDDLKQRFSKVSTTTTDNSSTEPMR